MTRRLTSIFRLKGREGEDVRRPDCSRERGNQAWKSGCYAGLRVKSKTSPHSDISQIQTGKGVAGHHSVTTGLVALHSADLHNEANKLHMKLSFKTNKVTKKHRDSGGKSRTERHKAVSVPPHCFHSLVWSRAPPPDTSSEEGSPTHGMSNRDSKTVKGAEKQEDKQRETAALRPEKLSVTVF